MSHWNSVGGAGWYPHLLISEEVERRRHQIEFDRFLQIVGHLQSGADGYETPSWSFQRHGDDDQDAVEFLLACNVVKDLSTRRVRALEQKILNSTSPDTW